MMKRTPTKALSPMDRRIPDNPRYSDVGAKVDTGLTVQKVKHISNGAYLRRRDEYFYRVTAAQLGDLFAEYEAQDEDIAECKFEGGGTGEIVGGPRIVTVSATEEEASYDRPYLVIDVRPRDEYIGGHILQARSFPLMLLHQDKMHPEIAQFKNKDSTLIVVYDTEERAGEGIEFAQVLSQRGYENVFLLTGGMIEFAELYPHYVEGHVPESRVSPTRPSRRSGTSSSRRTSGGGSGGGGRGGSGSSHGGSRSAALDSMRASARSSRGGTSRTGSARSRAGSSATATSRALVQRSRRQSRRGEYLEDGDIDETRSDMSTASVADTVISRSQARKSRF